MHSLVPQRTNVACVSVTHVVVRDRDSSTRRTHGTCDRMGMHAWSLMENRGHDHASSTDTQVDEDEGIGHWNGDVKRRGARLVNACACAHHGVVCSSVTLADRVCE